MSATKSVRAATLASVSWSLPGLGRGALCAAAFLFCLVSALLLTALRLEITRLRYELSDLHRLTVSMKAGVAGLEVETATLAAPKRIEEKALKLGLVYPDQDRVVVLDE